MHYIQLVRAMNHGLCMYACRTILKVGNQINDGESNMGFTMDSLLKLNTSKAFDKKTSVLQYVITLLFRNDLDALLLTEDLKSVVEVCTYIHTYTDMHCGNRFDDLSAVLGLSFHSGFHQHGEEPSER